MNYTEQGSGDPVVMLDWTPWQTSGLVEALADKYRVFSVEPPSPSEGPRSPQDAAAAVAGIAEALGLNTYSVVGASLGADVAFHLALLSPGAISPLVLVSPTCVAAVSPQRWDSPELAATAMLAHPDDPAIVLPDPGRTASLASLAEGWRAAGGDASDRLPDLGCATLVVLGQEDRLVAREAGGAWNAGVPNCSVSYVYDAGHAIAQDRPDALANVVLDFLERRETFIVENRSSLINP